MARDGGSNDAKRKKAPQSAVARWASCGDSPCEAQTPPPLTNPGRPPRSRHTDASAESWCAALHQVFPCAQVGSSQSIQLSGRSMDCLYCFQKTYNKAFSSQVPCAQRQDVVVAHQPGGGDYLRINSLRRVERKGRQLECMLERCRDPSCMTRIGGRSRAASAASPAGRTPRVPWYLRPHTHD